MWYNEEWPIRLNCTRCGAFREYERESERVVRCGECDKRHSKASLHVVDPDKVGSYSRDESGTLLDTTP